MYQVIHPNIDLPNKQNYLKDVKKGKEVVNREKKVQDNYLELVKVCIEIAKSNPKLTVIFRRHPNETDENLKELFKNKPKNIKLVYKFTVTPWIIASDYYLHAGVSNIAGSHSLEKKNNNIYSK